MIGVLILLAAGAYVAWLVDTHYVAKRRPAIQADAAYIIQTLRENEKNHVNIKSQEVLSHRSNDRVLHSGSHVDQLGSRGNGGDVLRIDSRR